MQYEESLLGVRRACSLHMLSRMKLIGLLVVALVGCYSQPPQPEYPQPEEVSGPPGGGMDGPTYAQYEADSQPANYGYPSQGYTDPGVAPDLHSRDHGRPGANECAFTDLHPAGKNAPRTEVGRGAEPHIVLDHSAAVDDRQALHDGVGVHHRTG